MTLTEELKTIIKGEVDDTEQTRTTYSTDASVLCIKPQVIVFPKDTEDVKALVKFVSEKNKEYVANGKTEKLSLTPRSAGTDMSGAAIGESIIVDMNRYFQGVIGFNQNRVTVLPGTFYRDFEKETLKKGMFVPCYPASRMICTVGGMVGNNSAGEKTLTYGQTRQFVKRLKVVFENAEEYEVKPLSKTELDAKIAQVNSSDEKEKFEGNLYKKLFESISASYEEIQKAKPTTAKNSAGYALWYVWDGTTFDLTQLIVGSQGTLGIVTEIEFELIHFPKESRMAVIFLPDLLPIAPLVNEILPLKPISLESYDEATIRLAVKYFPDLIHSGKMIDFIRLGIKFIPEFLMALKNGYPKLVMLIQFDGDTQEELKIKVAQVQAIAKKFNLASREAVGPKNVEKYWLIRRESYNLLRKHSAGKSTATFIEDVVVEPKYLPEFLPKLHDILHSYNLTYSIAGHAGSGNFHIFPLIDFKDPKHADLIIEISEKVFSLVAEYHGSITAEHNDGISRTPFLNKMFSTQTLELFKQTKELFDPQYIFNPLKKVGATVEYYRSHIKS